MPHIDLRLDGDNCWPELRPGNAGPEIRAHVQSFGMAVLPAGMASGAPSIMLRIDLPDGSVVLAETSLALLLSVTDAMKAKYGDPRT